MGEKRINGVSVELCIFKEGENSECTRTSRTFRFLKDKWKSNVRIDGYTAFSSDDDAKSYLFFNDAVEKYIKYVNDLARLNAINNVKTCINISYRSE